MRKLRKSMLFALLLAAVVSCGGGGGGGSSSDASTPVNMEINLKTDLSKVPIGQLSSNRTIAPKRPELKDPVSVIDNLSNFIEGRNSIVSSGQVSSLSAGLPNRKIESPSQITVQEGGVAFLINSGISGFVNTKPLENQVQEYVESKFKFSPTTLHPNSNHLENLTLTMEKGSILFASINGNIKLSQVGKNNLFSATTNKPTIIGNDYKELLLLNGNLTIDKNVNLDDADDTYNRIEITGSNIINLQNSELKGTLDNLVGIGQKEFHPRTSFVSSGITLKNDGKITLNGKNSIGIYKSGYKTGKVENNGTITVDKNSVGMYMLDKDYDAGNDNTEDMLNTGNIELLGDKSIGILAKGSRNYAITNAGTIKIGNSSDRNNPSIAMYTDSKELSLNNLGTINIGRNSVGIYSVRNKGIENNIGGINAGSEYSLKNHDDGKIELSGKGVTGIYLSDGAIGINDGTITTVNADGGSIGVIGIKDSQFTNNGTISVNEGSVGIYGNGNNAVLKNEGIITAGKNSIGMYSTNGASVENNKTIKLTGGNAIGMYLTENSKGINNGEIITEGIVNKAVGIAIGRNAEFTNNGKIVINSNEGVGILIANGGIIKNYGDIQITGENAAREKRIDNIIIKVEGIANTLSSARRTASSLGIYVDSLGRTKPIEGLSNLGLQNADLLIGAEATEKTNATEVTVGNEVLEPFNKSIQSSNIANWNVKTGSLVWEADSEIQNNKISKVTLRKQSYTKFADEKTKDVAKGLDEKYTVASEKDKQIFNYMNTLKDAESLGKVYKEIDGSQYINVQQRINQTDNLLDNQISSLQKDNVDKAGHHVETFFNKDKHDFKTDEVPNTTSTAFGASYLFNNTDSNWGIYGGVAINNYKFKDTARSKENITMFKLGGYKTFDLNSVDWTLGGDVFISQNSMKRRIMAGKVYENKADYNAYGFSVKNEISKTYELGENGTIKPYGSLKLGYGSFGKIKEKDATMGLDVKGNSYYSVKPAAGIELGYAKQLTDRTKIKASLDLAYEHELGKIDHKVNKMRHIDTNQTYGKLKDAKDENRGNFRSGVKVGLETGNFNFSVKGGYDTKDKNSYVGVGLGVSF